MQPDRIIIITIYLDVMVKVIDQLLSILHVVHMFKKLSSTFPLCNHFVALVKIDLKNTHANAES